MGVVTLFVSGEKRMLNDGLVFLFCSACFLICVSVSYIWCSSVQTNPYSVIYIVLSAVLFVYLNSHLISSLLIESAAFSPDGFVHIYDDDFVLGVKEGFFALIFGYLFGVILGAYFGAKKKFKP